MKNDDKKSPKIGLSRETIALLGARTGVKAGAVQTVVCNRWTNGHCMSDQAACLQ